MSPRRETGGRIVVRLDTRSECYRHLAVYAIANGALVIVWWMKGGGPPWFIVPLIAWGFAVSGHFGQYYTMGSRVFYPETIPALLATTLTYYRFFPLDARTSFLGYIFGIGQFYGVLLIWLLVTGFIRRMGEGREIFLRFGTYTNDRFRISLKLPMTWEDKTGDFPEPDLVVHAADEYGTSIKVYASPLVDGPDCTIGDLEERARKYVRDLQGRPESEKKITLAGENVVETVYLLSSMKERTVTMCRNTIEYRIVCSSLPGTFDLYDPVFHESLHSVSFQ